MTRIPLPPDFSCFKISVGSQACYNVLVLVSENHGATMVHYGKSTTVYCGTEMAHCGSTTMVHYGKSTMVYYGTKMAQCGAAIILPWYTVVLWWVLCK